jgi:putative protease
MTTPDPAQPGELRVPELVCPAGTPAGLRAAVDAGADTVYCGLRNQTNARNFPGLNFAPDELAEGIAYAHRRGARVLLAVNSFPPAGRTAPWWDAVDTGVRLGADALIVSDIGVAAYAARQHPGQRLHLSVQAGASAPEAIRYYCERYGIKRAVLPRILTIAEVEALKAEIPCEIESFVFGNHGLMLEGRCSLTNFVTGWSTNMDGVCSPAGQVRYAEDARGRLKTELGGFTVDCFGCGESAGYPTLCKGRYRAPHRPDGYYAFEEPVSLNLAELLPDLMRAGVDALKIEGRQRSKAYVKAVVGAWRRAVDNVAAGRDPGLADLLALTEGQQDTPGAYASKRWR